MAKKIALYYVPNDKKNAKSPKKGGDWRKKNRLVVRGLLIEYTLFYFLYKIYPVLHNVSQYLKRMITFPSGQRRLVSPAERLANAENMRILRNQSTRNVKQEWDYERPCEHCGCLYLRSVPLSKRKTCCSNGKFIENEDFPKLFELPATLKYLLLERTEHFSSRSSYYNNVFSIAVTGYDNGRDVGCEQFNMAASLKMNGRSYHFFPNSSNQKFGGISNFTYDGSFQVEEHAASINEGEVDRRVNLSFLKHLHEELSDINPYCRELVRVGKVIHRVDDFENVVSMRAQINQVTNRFEVGVLVSHDNPLEMVYTYKLNGATISVPMQSAELEPLVYPLFFPFGENGWSKSIKHVVKYLPYLTARILMPERDSDSDSGFLQRLNKDGSRMLFTNRFQLMSRNMQHYIVEGVSRLVDDQLSFVKANNGFILNSIPEDITDPPEIDEERVEFTSTSKKFLNDSITGSPRHLKALAKNSLLIVEEMGKPHGFLTLTCNPYWPEIVERLFPGQDAYDRYYIFSYKKNNHNFLLLDPTS